MLCRFRFWFSLDNSVATIRALALTFVLTPVVLSFVPWRSGLVSLRGYRFNLGRTVFRALVLCVSLGYRYCDLGGNSLVSSACITHVACGGYFLFKVQLPNWHTGICFSNWRPCGRGGVSPRISENRFTIRISRNVEIIPCVSYISGALRTIDLTSEMPRSARAGCCILVFLDLVCHVRQSTNRVLC